jgi:hypothetical protein
MTPIEEIRTLLVALGSLGTITTGNMPDTPDVMGTIYAYGGTEGIRAFGQSGFKYERPAIQVAFRGIPNDFTGPTNKAYIAWNYLPTVLPGPLGAGITTEYHFINPQQSPFPVAPQDVNKRWKIGFNVYLTKKPS